MRAFAVRVAAFAALGLVAVIVYQFVRHGSHGAAAITRLSNDTRLFLGTLMGK